MTQETSVSVIIPCYNQAHYLGEVIESLLGQTRPAEEIIVVADGSPDHCRQVCSNYNQVIYYRQENQGLANARNSGLCLARGRYVVFLDADDRLLPHSLEQQLACFQNYPEAGFVYGRCRIIDERGHFRCEVETKTRSNGREEVYAQLLKQCMIACPASVMFRRDVVQQLGGFDQDLGGGRL